MTTSIHMQEVKCDRIFFMVIYGPQINGDPFRLRCNTYKINDAISPETFSQESKKQKLRLIDDLSANVTLRFAYPGLFGQSIYLNRIYSNDDVK